MNRHVKISMYIFFSVFLLILSACTTKQVEVKKVPEEGYIIVRNNAVFLSVIKRFIQK